MPLLLVGIMLVQAVYRMADWQFLEHLNVRHIPYDDWGGLTRISGITIAESRAAFVLYHDRLHRQYEYDHEHNEG